MDHVSTVVPTVSPVKVDVGESEFVMVPGPEIFTHAPTPAVGVLPASVVEPVLTQTVWSTPALAMEGTALPTTIMLSKVAAHGAFEIVHLKVLLPTPKPVIVVTGLVGVVIVPEPPIKVQSPVPAVGVLAAIVALELTQTVWSPPAVAIEGKAFVVIVTLSTDDVQGKFEIDQVSTVVPTVSPVKVEFAVREFVMVPGPETFIQRPTPAVGVFPASVVEPVLTQTVWSTPAFAMEGTALPTIIMLSRRAAHGGFVIVQRKVLLPTPKPVIPEVGLVGVVIVPAPPIKVQSPVPAVGVLAAITAPELTQTVWSGPASEVDVIPLVVIVILETEEAQGGLLIDQVRTVTPGVNPVTVVFRTSGFVIVPEPETFTHKPVPIATTFPAKVAVAVPVVAQSV